KSTTSTISYYHIFPPPLTTLLFPLRHPPTPTLFPYTTLFRSISSEPSIKGEGRQPISSSSYCCQRFFSQITFPVLTSRQCTKPRSEEHTSELQSLRHLVCRLLLEKKKTNKIKNAICNNLNRDY